MKLIHLSVASIVGCLLGLVMLVGVTLKSIGEVQVKQGQVAELQALQGRINDFSVASDSLLLLGADTGLLAAYQQEGESLQRRLQQVGADSAAGRKAAYWVEQLLDAVAAEVERRAGASTLAVGQGGTAPPVRSLIVLNQVAGLGSALDTALDALARERQGVIMREAWWIGGTLASAALLFGALSVFAFLLIHHRVTKPVNALAHTLNIIRGGDVDARTPVRGDDELADLTKTLNRLLDERQALDARLRKQNERLRQFHDLLEGSEDLCGILDADYRYLWVNRAYLKKYGLQRDEIVGLTVPEMLGADYFEQTVKPRIDRCLAGEAQRFETERDFPGTGLRKLLVRYYPIDVPGTPELHLGSVITDVTETREAEGELTRQAGLLEKAGRVARFGGWSADFQNNRVKLSNVVAEIFGIPHGHSVTVDEGIAFFAPEYRERIRDRLTACAEQGMHFDEESQIIDADGQPKWVRALGEPVHDEHGQVVRVQGAFQDVTKRHEREQHLRRLAQIIDQSPATVVVTDLKGLIEYVNPAFEESSGYSRAEVLGQTPARIKGGNMPGAVYRELWETITSGRVWTGELQNRRKNGTLYWESMVISPLRDERGQIIHYVAINQDITALKQAELELRASRDELMSLLESRKALINSLPAHIALLDAEGTIIDVNDQWRRFGEENDYAGDDFGLGANYLRVCESANGDCSADAAKVAIGVRAVLAGEEDAFALEYPCHSPEQFRWFRVMANRLVPGKDDNAHHGAVVVHFDITERKRAEQELNRIAFEDPLTGLYSRDGFARQLQLHIDRYGWQARGAVVMVDIAGQRDINDAYGYEGGDRLLFMFGRRLCERAGEYGCAGRIGGDEFMLFLRPSPGETLNMHLGRLVESMSVPFELNGIEVEVPIRLGYTRMGERQRPVQDLLREAERALFRHHTDPSSPWVAYSTHLEEETQQRIELTRDLRRGLNNEQFELHFQPKVDLATGSLVACEALLRWNHPERGLVPPGVFIPIAEQSQLIVPIGDWVLRRACRHLHDWHDAGLQPVRVAVNVSQVQFQVGDLASRVPEILDEFGVAPEDLVLEITESVFEHESESLLNQMRALHDIGVRLSLDDFGTGYSSLLYLQRYPFDEVKIDQGFVFRLLDDPFSRSIVETVLVLARALDAEAVAEGIESAAVADALEEMGCRFGQGYFYSMPLEAEDFCWLLEQRCKLPLRAHHSH